MKVGVLGGGQLARMLALAGFPLGIEVIGVDNQKDCSASKVTRVLHAELNDIAAIEAYFHDVDCVTYETENIPVDVIAPLAKRFKLFPSLDAITMSQDRWHEKNFFSDLSIPTPRYLNIETQDDINTAIAQLGLPLLLKTRRNGYDGKGQYVVRRPEEAKLAWETMQHIPFIAEEWVPFQFEVSQVAVRNQKGEMVFYPLTRNYHEEGILQQSIAPFHHPMLQEKAQQYTRLVLEKLNYVGVLAIEFFCVDDHLIANEMAPRVHNSGHWTIEGADTSQFENHLRAILGLPLGSPEARGACAMINLIGKAQSKFDLLEIPGLHYHWYDKSVKPKRKLGHVTLCADTDTKLMSLVQRALSIIAY